MAVVGLGDEVLKKITQEIVVAIRIFATIGGKLKFARDAVRAKLRRLLAEHDYPPDTEANAIEMVLEQTELFATRGAT